MKGGGLALFIVAEDVATWSSKHEVASFIKLLIVDTYEHRIEALDFCQRHHIHCQPGALLFNRCSSPSTAKIFRNFKHSQSRAQVSLQAFYRNVCRVLRVDHCYHHSRRSALVCCGPHLCNDPAFGTPSSLCTFRSFSQDLRLHDV